MSYISMSYRALLIVAASALMGACTSMDRQRDLYPDPNVRLNHLLALYANASEEGDGCKEIWKADHAITDCQRIQKEVERLYTENTLNPRIIMANATMNYEAGKRDKAQFLLDQVLDQYGAHPDAAVMRAHLAMEEGNAKFAIEMLERQIMLRPDHYGLREAQGAAYYLLGEFKRSRSVLGVAGRLGAPGWRLSYHHGLMCESEKKWEQACRLYATALEQKYDFMPARARLTGLTEHAVCRSPEFFNALARKPVPVKAAVPVEKPVAPEEKAAEPAATPESAAVTPVKLGKVAIAESPKDVTTKVETSATGESVIVLPSTAEPAIVVETRKVVPAPEPVDQTNRIEALTYHQYPNGRMEIELTMSHPGTFVESFSDSSRAPILSVELRDVQNAQPQNSLQINSGATRDVKLTQLNDRVRLDIQLTSAAQHDIQHRDNKVIIAIIENGMS